MDHRIRIAESDFMALRETLLRDAPQESAAFLLAGVSKRNGADTLLARRLVTIPREFYRIKGELHLDISPEAINGLVALCEANGLGAIFCHSHPGAGTNLNYSPSDDHGERRLAAAIRQAVPHAPVGSLLLSESAMTGRIWTPRGPVGLDSLTSIGRALQPIPLITRTSGPLGHVSELFGRQVLAFGEAGQAALAQTKVAIVGVGGTGSALAEILVRMGVEDLVLIDDDVFSPSNVTRVFGSFAHHASPRWFHRANWRRPMKVQVVARHLRAIRRGIRINSVTGNVLAPENAALLLDRDVIFSCTDEHWGRSLLNQISYQYLIPCVNLGLRIDAKEGKLIGGTGVVHILRPGRPCLWCYDYLKSEKIRAESLHPEEHRRLAEEKYVVGLGSAAPAVASLTATVAGLAANQLLELVTDFMGPSGAIDCLRLDALEGDVRRGTAMQLARCACKQALAFGDLAPIGTCADRELLKRIAEARHGGGPLLQGAKAKMA